MKNDPFVSVIIPVFNDAECLRLCLNALGHQTYPAQSFEIIVVDNGSSNPNEVNQIVALYKNAILAHEPIPGSYAARNTGLSLAKGRVIAFTDADCIPATDWLEAGVKVLNTVPHCGLVAGQIQMFFCNPNRPTMIELYESIMGLPQKLFLEKHHYGATANVFTTRQIIEKVGVFDSGLKSSGDVEWGQRVYAQNYCQVYAESALVRHPTHASWPSFIRRIKRLSGGHYDLKMKQAKTFLHRQIIFLESILKNLTPPVLFVLTTFSDKRLHGFKQKLQVSLIMFLVRYVSALEILRLKLGGVSNRD